MAGRYRPLRELGRGGAAVIYLAADLKHDRQVALKVFRPDLAATLGTERFLREIKIAANLAHPHILPVHDSGEAQGFLYYVMPVVEGRSLGERLGTGERLPLAEVTSLLHDVLDALQYAHTRGVVHRDIKPGNVMLAGRHALVTDFGVAKALAAAAEGHESDTAGLVLGTPAYMAPEQAMADPDIDHRADIYSVGAVAYEMLTGRPPFGGTSTHEIMTAVVSKPPTPVTELRPDLPPELARVVMKCLEKDPDRRYQTAEEAVQDLNLLAATPGGGLERISVAGIPAPLGWTRGRRLATAVVGTLLVLALLGGWLLRRPAPATAADLPVIVVLPFENLGPPEDSYFANGVTDAITARLATLGTVGVISRTSAMHYRDSELSPREIGAQLGADYVLEGTIQRERPSDPSSRVRIIPQLIRASDDTHLWAGVYDEDLTEVFRVQSDIAGRVARAMDVTLLGGQRQQLAERPIPDNLEAYELYLRGHDYLEGNRGNGDANARRIAIDFFDQAIAVDPEYGQAWAELSLAHIWLYRYFVDRSDQRARLAKAAVDSALALTPGLSTGHLALGLYSYWGPEPDPESALREFRHVAEREPNNAYARTLIAVLQATRGVWDDAVENASLAAELDPREPEWAVTAGFLHMLTRQYEEAEHYLDMALAIAPDLAEAHQHKMALYLRWDGDTTRAHAAAREMLRTVTPGQVAVALVQVAPELVVGGAYDSILDPLSAGAVSGPLPFDYLLTKAEFYRLRNRAAESHAYYDSLAAVLRTAARAPDDPMVGMLLGRAYAGLGRRAEALAQAERLEAVIAGAGDALQATVLRSALAWIYALVGQDEASLAHLEELLAQPSPMSVPYLRIAAIPGTVRDHPRFSALLERMERAGVAAERRERAKLAGLAQ